MTADRLNFREECGTSSPVLGVLTRDETVTVLGSELGTWIRVRNGDGEEGCVSAQYLEIEPTGAVEAEATTSPSEESSPYAWADLTDSDSAEIVSEIEELETDLAATSDPDEQEDLRQEIAELEDDLRARQEDLAEEREEAAREAGEAEFAAHGEAAEQQAEVASRAGSSTSTRANWTGFYVGVSAGYGFGDEVAPINGVTGEMASEEDIDGFDVGVQLGWSYQFSRFVLGVEGDFQISNQNGTSVDLGEIGFPGSRTEIEFDSYGTVRARAGFAVGGALLYATGGFAQMDADVQFTGPLGDVIPPDSVSLDGFAIGAGVETGLNGRLSLKGEVVYHEFDDEPELVDTEFFSARVGLNWHF